ncbi:hypothetical protein RYX36_001361, partial [Vicia faba]
MSGVWVFDKKGVVRLITNPTRESFETKPEHPRPGTATATAPGARPRVLVHLPTNQVITSFSQLEQRLNELDAHQSEFIAECYARREYISGFTGSAGTAIVTSDKAALWTGGRYFLQAEKQLNSNWILMRARNPGVPTTSEWLNEVLAPGVRVGIDPFLFTFDAAEELKQ